MNYYRQADWSSLGWSEDPVPGAPEIVEDYAGRFRTTAKQAGDAAQLLRSFSTSGMISYSVDKLLAESTALAGRLTLVESRYVGAAGALAHYAPVLRTARDRSWQLLQEAGPLREQERQAHNRSKEMYWQLQTMPCGPQRDGLVDQYQDNERARVAQLGNIQSAKATLKSICDERDRAAESAAGIIKRAMEASGLNDSIVDHVQELFHNLDKWVQENAENLSKFGDVLGWVGTGLKIIGTVFPPAALLGLAVSAVGAVCSVAGAYGKARRSGNWGSFWVAVGSAALSVGAGKLLGKVGKAVGLKSSGGPIAKLSKQVTRAGYKLVRRLNVRASTALEIVRAGKKAFRQFVVKPAIKWAIHQYQTTPILLPSRPPRPCAPPPCYPPPVMNCQRVYVGAPA